MQCILGDCPTLGFERILKQFTHMGIPIVLKYQQQGDRPERIASFTKTSITSIVFIKKSCN